MGSHPACLPASHSRPSRFARAARVVALATATGLLSGCGVSASAPAGSARAHSHTQSAISTPTPASALASYCDARDTPIPGATSALANGDLSLPNLTAIEQAWFQMYATMVPACSEITPHPLPVETKNLTNGQLSDAELATWVQLDSAGWALWEWAGQHDQFEFMRFLLPSGNDVTAFIELGGSVVDESRVRVPVEGLRSEYHWRRNVPAHGRPHHHRRHWICTGMARSLHDGMDVRKWTGPGIPNRLGERVSRAGGD